MRLRSTLLQATRGNHLGPIRRCRLRICKSEIGCCHADHIRVQIFYASMYRRQRAARTTASQGAVSRRCHAWAYRGVRRRHANRVTFESKFRVQEPLHLSVGPTSAPYGIGAEVETSARVSCECAVALAPRFIGLPRTTVYVRQLGDIGQQMLPLRRLLLRIRISD